MAAVAAGRAEKRRGEREGHGEDDHGPDMGPCGAVSSWAAAGAASLAAAGHARRPDSGPLRASAGGKAWGKGKSRRTWRVGNFRGGARAASVACFGRIGAPVGLPTGEFQNAYTAQALLVFCDKAVDADVIVVAFRGTRPLDAARWCADVDPSWYKIPRLGRAHAAYTHALGAQRNIGWPKWVEHIKGKPQKVYAYYTIRDSVKELLEANKKARLLVTGHGSGGALAVLFPAIVAYHKEKAVLDRLGGVYTFGQPRLGDAMLAMFVERNLDRPKKRHFRITYGDDPLRRLPNESSAVHFLHFGLGLHFDKSYNLKVLREIPDEATSSSPLDFVRSRINSAWELGRSLHLGYWRGAYFREGWLLLLMRVLALAPPGLPFHRVQDYVNAVVLGGYIPKDN